MPDCAEVADSALCYPSSSQLVIQSLTLMSFASVHAEPTDCSLLYVFHAFVQTLQAAMKDAGVTTEQLDWLVLHQANQRILDAAAQRIGISSERVISNLAEYGNTSAASIPLAFDEAVRGSKIKSGDTVSNRALAGLFCASASMFDITTLNMLSVCRLGWQALALD